MFLVALLSLFWLFSASEAVDSPDLPDHAEKMHAMYDMCSRIALKMGLSEVISCMLRDATEPFDMRSVLQEFEARGHSFDEVSFLLSRETWHTRTDGQPILVNSTCDIVMTEYDDWSLLDVLTRRVITDCVNGRLYLDALRTQIPAIHWLPQDLLTNPYRKYVFGFDLIRSMLVSWQYESDRKGSLERASQWSQVGLNVSHYTHVETEEDLALLSATYSLDDYMAWNGAGQREAVDWLLERWSLWVKQSFLKEDIDTVFDAVKIVSRTFLKF
jgi:hypothetical protein